MRAAPQRETWGAGVTRAVHQHVAMMSFTTPTPSPRDRSDSALVPLLSDFLRHLSAGDAHAAAALWDVPALILGDEHVHGPLSRDRLAEVLADAPGAGALERRARRDGEAPTELLVEHVEWTSQRVAAVYARWPRLPQGGLLHGIEAGTFLVRIDEFSQPKIRGLVLHSARLAPA
jgi:hypothetical protein